MARLGNLFFTCNLLAYGLSYHNMTPLSIQPLKKCRSLLTEDEAQQQTIQEDAWQAWEGSMSYTRFSYSINHVTCYN